MRADFIHSFAIALRAIVSGRMLLVGMAVAVSLPSVAQDTASQLETIKAEVLNAAVADGVSVVSSAYINGDGQLVESSFYRAGGGIRGIRMQALLEDQNADVHAGYIETSPLNPKLSCDQLPPPRYARSLAL
jgi:hypothetical protein